MADRAEFELGVVTEPLKRGLESAKKLFVSFGSAIKDKLKQVAGVLLEQIPLFVADFTTKLREGFAALREFDPLMSRIEALIRSTGAAAGFTSRELSEMTREFRDLNATSTQAVLSAEEVLLRLTNIRGDVFRGALEASADLAAVLGGDLVSAASKVGEALNNPIEGLRILRQEGILFTLQEGQMIEALVYAGRVMDAQRIILNKLNDAFGGEAARAADTWTGKLNIMNNALTDAWRLIADALTPAFDLLLPVIKDGSEFVEEMAKKLRSLTEEAVAFVQDSWPMIKQWIDRVAEGALKLASFVADKLLQAFTVAQTAVENWEDVFEAARLAAQLGWLKLIDALRDPWANFVVFLEETLVSGLRNAARNALAEVFDMFRAAIKEIPRVGGSPLARDLEAMEMALSGGAFAMRAAGGRRSESAEEREERLSLRRSEVAGERDTAEMDELGRLLEDALANLTPDFEANLNENRSAFDSFIGQLKEGFEALSDITPSGDSGEPSDRPFVLSSGGEGRGGDFEGLDSLRRRIQSAAFKTPEAIALDKQTLVIQAQHQENMQAQAHKAKQDHEDADKIVKAVEQIQMGYV